MLGIHIEISKGVYIYMAVSYRDDSSSKRADLPDGSCDGTGIGADRQLRSGVLFPLSDQTKKSRSINEILF